MKDESDVPAYPEGVTSQSPGSRWRTLGMCETRQFAYPEGVSSQWSSVTGPL